MLAPLQRDLTFRHIGLEPPIDILRANQQERLTAHCMTKWSESVMGI